MYQTLINDIFRAIQEQDTDRDVIEEMKKILQLLQGHEESKTETGKSSKGAGGRRSTTPDEKYVITHLKYLKLT